MCHPHRFEGKRNMNWLLFDQGECLMEAAGVAGYVIDAAPSTNS